MSRPAESAHHSSTIQSLYAFTQEERGPCPWLQERLAAEPRERREAERRSEVVDVHVLDRGFNS